MATELVEKSVASAKSHSSSTVSPQSSVAGLSSPTFRHGMTIDEEKATDITSEDNGRSASVEGQRGEEKELKRPVENLDEFQENGLRAILVLVGVSSIPLIRG
jgi:hypothetical protein